MCIKLSLRACRFPACRRAAGQDPRRGHADDDRDRVPGLGSSTDLPFRRNLSGPLSPVDCPWPGPGSRRTIQPAYMGWPRAGSVIVRVPRVILERDSGVIENHGGTSIPDPGPGCGRDAAGPGRDVAAADRWRRWRGRRGRAFDRYSAPAGAIAAPGRSPSNSASTLRSCATPGRSSRIPPTTARSGGPTSTPSWPPTSSSCSAPMISPPSSSPTVVPTTPTSSSRRYPTGREAFDDYVDQNREHAEINADWRWNTAAGARLESVRTRR